MAVVTAPRIPHGAGSIATPEYGTKR